MSRLHVREEGRSAHVHDGLVVPHKPYFALYSYKVYHSERFDLLGNCLAILTGIASPSRARRLIGWIEAEVKNLHETGQLSLDLPPCLFPYIRPEDPDWRPRRQAG